MFMNGLPWLSLAKNLRIFRDGFIMYIAHGGVNPPARLPRKTSLRDATAGAEAWRRRVGPVWPPAGSANSRHPIYMPKEPYSEPEVLVPRRGMC